MQYPCRNFALLLLTLAMFLSIAACGERRSTQCQKVANAANKANSDSMAVSQKSIGQLAYDPKRELELARVRGVAAKKIEAVEVSDKNLKQIKSRLVNAYLRASVSARQTAKLMPENGLVSDSVGKEIDALRLEAEKDIPPAIHELNIYCIDN